LENGERLVELGAALVREADHAWASANGQSPGQNHQMGDGERRVCVCFLNIRSYAYYITNEFWLQH